MLVIIGIGIDIIAISRIKKAAEQWGERFLKRVFCAEEFSYAMSKARPYVTLAGMFAAKEACAKALGCGIGSVAWQDMQIKRDVRGRPFILIDESLVQKITGVSKTNIHLSISHDDDKAIAVVMLETHFNLP